LQGRRLAGFSGDHLKRNPCRGQPHGHGVRQIDSDRCRHLPRHGRMGRGQKVHTSRGGLIRSHTGQPRSGAEIGSRDGQGHEMPLRLHGGQPPPPGHGRGLFHGESRFRLQRGNGRKRKDSRRRVGTVAVRTSERHRAGERPERRDGGSTWWWHRPEDIQRTWSCISRPRRCSTP